MLLARTSIAARLTVASLGTVSVMFVEAQPASCVRDDRPSFPNGVDEQRIKLASLHADRRLVRRLRQRAAVLV